MAKKTESAQTTVRRIRRKTRKKYSAEDKIRMVIEGLRGEMSVAELCRKEGISQSLYYKWSKEFLDAGKRRLSGDTEAAYIFNPRLDEVQLLKAINDELNVDSSADNAKELVDAFFVECGFFQSLLPNGLDELIDVLERGEALDRVVADGGGVVAQHGHARPGVHHGAEQGAALVGDTPIFAQRRLGAVVSMEKAVAVVQDIPPGRLVQANHVLQQGAFTAT